MKQLNAILMALILFVACAAPPSNTLNTKDMPEWFLVPKSAEDAWYAVGLSKKKNPQLARTAAAAIARDELSRQIEVKVSGMVKNFMQESGIGESAQALEFTEAVTKQVTSNSVSGSRIAEVYPANDGTLYVLVEYSLDQVKNSALSAAKSAAREEALYNEFKASQAFDELDASVD